MKKNYYNSIAKNKTKQKDKNKTRQTQIIQFKNLPRSRINIFPKKTYKWSTSTCKGDQHH